MKTKNKDSHLSTSIPEGHTTESEQVQNPVTNQKKPQRPKGLSRRDFLKLMGASSVMAMAACRRPVEEIVPAVIRSPETQPGIPTFYSSTTPDGIGIVVRTRSGRPIKIAGNPDHPLTKGGLSPSQVASLMDLYDPDRLRRSAVIDPKSGKKTYRKEELIVPVAQSKLKKGKYVLLTGPVHSPSSRALIKSFLRKYPNGKHIEFRPDPTIRQIAEGQEVSYGKTLLPFYRFDRADLVCSIDGDFLGSMPLAPVYSCAYAKRRELREANSSEMIRLLVFESMYTVTGSNADERYGIRPTDQSLVALSIAAHIVIEMRKSRYAKNTYVRNFLSGYLPKNISNAFKHETGLYQKGHFERCIARIGAELWVHRGRSIIIGGSPLAANGNNSSAQIAFNLLNSILENDGKTIDYQQTLYLPLGAQDRDIQTLIAELESGAVETLIFSNANIVYHMPQSLKVAQALKKGPKYILSLNDRIDETGALANAILPTSHYLESWGDTQILKGIASVQQPVIRPLYQTLSFEDRLIQLAGGQLDGKKNFHDFIIKRWRSHYSSVTKNFRKSWVSWLQAGYRTQNKNLLSKKPLKPRTFLTANLERLPRFQKEGTTTTTKENQFYLGLYYNIQVGDGSLANNAYRQELPDPVTKIVWDNYVCLLPETARSLGLKQGDVVEVANGQNTNLRLPVHLQPGLHPQAVLIALGYGRSTAGKVANKIGKNATQFVNTGSDSFSFSGMPVSINGTGEVYELATTQAIYRHGTSTNEKAFFAPEAVHELPYRGSSQHGRPIIRETTYQEFKTGEFELQPAAVKYPKKQELTKQWDYDKTRWHMIIDLNACTGCGACVTSCNTENNIPMVGKDEVKVGREMHWLRIDRYFNGNEESPEIGNQPMLCQHCENAPCENVCPVAATTHNSEGLNVMTYNRCIGTRYCANNCPYKVRRFNWFENWSGWKGQDQGLRDPQHLALNPDVTVRSRGVMEKCTFCVQRISTARQEARTTSKDNTPIADGQVKTACQEVCPSKAISFGNILDPKSEVAKLRKKEKRTYQVLDFLGVKPQVSYLAKVKHKEPQGKTKQNS